MKATAIATTFKTPTVTTEPEYHLPPGTGVREGPVTGVIRPIQPPAFVPSGSSKAKTYGGIAMGASGLIGGLILLLKGGSLGRGTQIGSGLASAAAVVGGPALTVAGIKQKREEQEAYEDAYREGVADDVASVPVLPQTEVIESALSRCTFLKRALIVPGTEIVSASGVTPLPGDWEATVYDRERKREYTVLCTDQPRDGMRELTSFYVSDPGAGMASAKNYVSFPEDWLPDKHYYRQHTWGRGDKIPSSTRNQIWAMPLGEGGFTNLALGQYIANLATAMNRPMPTWIMGFSGDAGGPLVRMDRAFTVQTDLWKDVFRSVVFGVLRAAVAIIVGFLAAGPVGSALAAVGIVVGTVVAEIIAVVGYLAYETYKIIKEIKKTGRIGGNMEDLYQVFAVLASTSETVSAYVAQFEDELYGVMSYFDQARDAGKAILARYREVVTWANGLDDELERMGAQMVVGLEGSIASLASNISGRAKDKYPWDMHGGAVRLIEAKIEGTADLTGTLPPLP